MGIMPVAPLVLTLPARRRITKVVTQLGLDQHIGRVRIAFRIADNPAAHAFDYSYRKPLWLILVPIVERCGHRIRFVSANEDPTNFYSYVETEDAGGLNADAITYLCNYGVASPAHRTITCKVQIDLTDAAPGFETWTDIGPILSISNF